MNNDIERALAAPYDVDMIRWRIGKGPYERKGKYSAMLLAYIDARDVMERLDRILGNFGWQTEMTATDKGVICKMGVYDGEFERWVWKSDGAQYTDFEAFKGGCSEALRRVAVQFGVGRYLYSLSDLDPYTSWVYGTRQRRVGVPMWVNKENNEKWYFPPDEIIDKASSILNPNVEEVA